MIYLIIVFSLTLIILSIFFFTSKQTKFDILANSIFECGFTSYFFSRFSFSIHYFMVGLIFLFLDLELCYLLPFFNEDSSSLILDLFFLVFIVVLVMGLLEEWKSGFIDWKY